jgi:hypothetical protein
MARIGGGVNASYIPLQSYRHRQLFYNHMAVFVRNKTFWLVDIDEIETKQ